MTPGPKAAEVGYISTRCDPETGLEFREFCQGYFVSINGEIRSAKNWIPLKPFVNAGGYFECTIRPGGVKKLIRVHTAVAQSWVRVKPFPEAVVRHLNGNPKDNRPCNLEWGSVKENVADTVRHGRRQRGERAGPLKLTEARVEEIISLLVFERWGTRLIFNNEELAGRFGVNRSTIARIVNGKYWAHIDRSSMLDRQANAKSVKKASRRQRLEYKQYYQRFVAAAEEFCVADREMSEIRGRMEKCSEAVEGDASIGDLGVGPCRYEKEGDTTDWCAACLLFVDNQPKFKAAMRARQLAKARMLRSFMAARKEAR